MYLASMYLPGLGRSLLTGVFWSAFPLYVFVTTRTKILIMQSISKMLSKQTFHDP